MFKRRRCATIKTTGVPLVLAGMMMSLIPSWSSWTNHNHHQNQQHHHCNGQVSALQVSMMIPPVFTTIPPIFGIGAILFPVRGTTISVLGDSGGGDANDNIRRDIDDATDFFVDAFWTAKVGGGTQSLSERQRQQLFQSQQAEFNKRYGGAARRRRNSSSSSSANNKKTASAFLIMRGPKRKKRASTTFDAARNAMIQQDDDDDRGEILACVGIEVQGIANGAVRGLPIQEYAPLMSNLAVSRNYRRRGLAEAMVQAAEDYIRGSSSRNNNNNDWPEDYRQSLYLYVERRNTRAIQLYQKLGYRRLWQDGNAQTLLPMDNGDLQSVPTVLVCMKKNLQRSSNNPFARLLG
jgi:ribosomal protein S18 acetylase RimI-like enzyme